MATKLAIAGLALGCSLAAQTLAPVHHKIATNSLAAQRAFDRGLALVYGFNYQAAEGEFRRASSLDPSAPMPYWGLALALGPNLNEPWPSPAAERQASDALSRARTLAAKLPPSPESREERAYIAALTLRFTCQPRADYPRMASDYANAMNKLSAAYPDDPDAETLYAAALMVERRNARWGSLAPPLPKRDQILAVLENVLRRWPGYIGASHFYIHASEGSGDPARALPSARILDQLDAHGFFGDGHLLHMPAHIYLRTGHYRAAERSTLAAAAADRTYLAANPSDLSYAAGYAQHNLAFLVVAASMDGDYRVASAAAHELAIDANLTAERYPTVVSRELAPLEVDLRFARWQEILDDPPRVDADASLKLFASYARASALSSEERTDPAREAMRTFRYALSRTPQFRVAMPALGPSQGRTLLLDTLNARLAAASGHYAFAIEQLQQAVELQDGFGYREPPVWYPLRESLGAVLLRAGEVSQAEAVFRACLKSWPKDPRAEFGLSKALERQGKTAAAQAAQRAFQREWKGGPLRLEELF